ncbi:hypothetical protein D9758_004315 [Tetrapyrgos nigripes]|uniref:Helicase ATP-binding domain-containing protein n=1 Tax=Tetrapyrgos nigripes TaxID=182062 RepID=A0A8H5GUQ2_9AGAR|nr:hypothetical protein D9758_004315 [Tetrapyrgos nigripes]
MPPRKKTTKRKDNFRSAPPRRKLATQKDLKNLLELLKKQLGFKPHDFQVHAIQAQPLGKDVVVHAGTGSGKTVIAAGPHLHNPKSGVTLFISPLIGLQNEQDQVQTFSNQFKLKAVAVNSQHGGCKPELLQSIIRCEYNIVILSPEMLLLKQFVETVL